jgi:predicted peptidase
MIAHKVMLCALIMPAIASGAPDLSRSVTGTVGAGAQSMPYRLFRPPQFDQPGRSFPLVLFMHGAGERGTDNVAQVASHIDGLVTATQSAPFASYLVAPQLPPGTRWVDYFGNTSYDAATAPQQNAWMGLTLDLVDRLIGELNVDVDRVYVTGLSLGGYGAWDILVRRPGMFAAAMPMSGGGNIDAAPLLRDVPIWAFHGGNDTVVQPAASSSMISSIRAAGGEPLYVEFPGAGHAIWNYVYSDPPGQVYPWLFSQVPEPAAVLPGLIVMLLAQRRSHR